jgi:hypothetical protein
MAGGIFGDLGSQGLTPGSSTSALLGGTGQSDAGGVDAAWYMAQYPDVAAAVRAGVMTPEQHYAMYGKAEGRFPNAKAAAGAGQADQPIAAAPDAAPAQTPNWFPGFRSPDQETKFQNGNDVPEWAMNARQSTANMNAMPFVLDPMTLNGGDQAANKAQMFRGPVPQPQQAQSFGFPQNPLLFGR